MKRGLITKGAFKKMSEGHPWLTATDLIDKKGHPPRAGAFQFGDHWWLFSPESFLRMRRLGPPQKSWMHTPRFNVLTNADQFVSFFGDWLLAHFKETLVRKTEAVGGDTCLRWIFSENDFVPGLIVDVFDKTLVAQINSAPIEVFWVHIRKLLVDAFRETRGHEPVLLERRNASIRKKEDLEVIESDDTPAPQVLKWNGLLWNMQPGGTQKTGAYFDQRDNHTRVTEVADTKIKRPAVAWDLCSHEGGFGLHLAKKGFAVVAVDQSESALAAGRANAELNQIPSELFKTEKADVFKWLETQKANGAKAPLIVLDPPSFVKSRDALAAAYKGYVELNQLALDTLAPKGILVSCVCSHHITPKLFEKLLTEAGQKAGRKFKILEKRGPSADHAAPPGFTEGHYLQTWLIEAKD